jgi:sugar (pentulose or hexulose) kinase
LLPDGLNIGSQLHWLERLNPSAMRDAVLIPWAQYWAWFLSGMAVSEVTSLGCHSDLWAPATGDFSPMAKQFGWADRFAPLTMASDVIGTLRPELAARTGLSPKVRIHAGLHDSNAALLAARGFGQIGNDEATVLSTGTWFVAMRSPAEPVNLVRLSEERDCLINVDVAGQAVPSARFMGGREIELLGERIDRPGTEGAADILYSGAMILPSQVRGCGPFPDGFGRWINRPENPAERAAAIAMYAALMADTSLDLIGSRDRLLVEGRFASSEIFVRALAALRPGTEVLTTTAEVDASFGALRLILPDLVPPGELSPVEPLRGDVAAYRDEWFDDIAFFA